MLNCAKNVKSTVSLTKKNLLNLGEQVVPVQIPKLGDTHGQGYTIFVIW